MRFHTFYISILILSIFSCYRNDSDSKFTKDLSEDKFGKPAFGYERLNEKLELLNLDNATNGYDSLLIRIWYEPQLWMTTEVIELKYNSKKWSGKHIEFRQSYIEGTDSIKQEKIVNDIIPKNGWEHLINQLYENDITSLPNMMSIQGLEDGWTDGVCYNVEISSKNFYRYYSYHLPEYFQDKFEDPRKMVEILNIIETEFGVENLYLRKRR